MNQMGVTNWFNKPYSDDMDVIHWALFILLVMVIASGWRHTLKILESAT